MNRKNKFVLLEMPDGDEPPPPSGAPPALPSTAGSYSQGSSFLTDQDAVEMRGESGASVLVRRSRPFVPSPVLRSRR